MLKRLTTCFGIAAAMYLGTLAPAHAACTVYAVWFYENIGGHQYYCDRWQDSACDFGFDCNRVAE